MPCLNKTSSRPIRAWRKASAHCVSATALNKAAVKAMGPAKRAIHLDLEHACTHHMVWVANLAEMETGSLTAPHTVMLDLPAGVPRTSRSLACRRHRRENNQAAADQAVAEGRPVQMFSPGPPT